MPYVEHDGVKLTGDFYAPEGARQGAGDHRGPWRRLAGRKPGCLQVFRPVARPQRLRGLCHPLPAVEAGGEELSGLDLRREGGDPVRPGQGRRPRGRSRAHRAAGGVRGCPTGVAGGRRRKRAAVLHLVSRRSQRRGFRRRQGRRLVLWRLQHAGPVGARSPEPPRRLHHRKVPRGAAVQGPPGVFRSLARTPMRRSTRSAPASC